jgi:class 3 adenylate cyclase
MDGAGNNKAHPTRGMKGALFLRQRQGAAHYHTADGSIMPNSPNPRDISNALNANDRKLMNPRKLNDAHTVWGQFIDHDFTLTPDNGSEPLHVPVPKCDVFFDPDCTGNEIIGFHRSNYKMFNGTREQINQVSAYLDASMVYGSDPERAAALRSFVNGKLLIDADGHVPLNNGKIDQANGANRNGMRMTGDVRGNVTPLMLAYHSLFVREHNRYCDVLQKTHPTWDDETLYQEARRRVAAHIQHITYREYLPALLGEPLPLYAGYDPTIDAGVENLFAASTFRYGHAEVNGVILRLSDQWVEIEEGHLYLRDSFFNPQLGLSAGIEPLLRGMLFKGQAAVDVRYHVDMRHHLFSNPSRSPPADLLSRNIQRGRDHGLPTYNQGRQNFGLPAYKSFDQVTSDPIVQQGLKAAYSSVDDIDVYIGALAEDKAKGNLGELMTASLADQFHRMRAGDRFWYENDQFTPQELQAIRETRLIDIIQRNTNITYNYRNAFLTHDSQMDGGLFPLPPVKNSELENEFEYTQRLDDGFVLYWTIDHSQSKIQFAALARTSGWVGFGISQFDAVPPGKTAMYHADMVIGRVADYGPTVGDYFSFELGVPSLDTAIGCEDDMQDASLEMRNDGTRVMRFTRRFETTDSMQKRGRLQGGNDVIKQSETVQCDAPIVLDQKHLVLYAFNPVADELAYHGATRGTARVVLAPKPMQQVSMLPVIFISLGVLLLVLVVAVGVAWYFTRRMRVLAKQFSNNNIAEQCAEAVARFDLDSVSWLHTLKNPNKIQRSFMQITALLAEVRPYIPDQLLATLTNPEAEDDDQPTARDSSDSSSSHSDDHSSSAPTSARKSSRKFSCKTNESDTPGRARRKTNRFSVAASEVSSISRDSDVVLSAGQRYSMSSPSGPYEISKRLSVIGEPSEMVYKRCTYLFVKLWAPFETTTPSIVWGTLSSVLSQVITIGKQHGATVSTVTSDSVALYWGGAGTTTVGGCLNAVKSGLEIHKIKDVASGAHCLQIAVGIGSGMCAMATVSAAKLRFFVILGDEVSFVTDMVTSKTGPNANCPLLISPALYKEVQYDVECYPRVTYKKAVLWEPLGIRERGCTDTEWMYEIVDMDGAAEKFSGDTLYELFKMLVSSKPHAAVASAVEVVKEKHADKLKPKDHDTLQRILQASQAQERP